MAHIRSALPPLLLSGVLALSACGTQSADAPALDSRARALGIEPAMVYVTDVPGYSVALQSVGVIGDHGFGASYTGPDGGTIELRVDERAYAGPVGCEDSAGKAGTDQATCEQEGNHWYRATGTSHSYVLEDADRVIRLSADTGTVSRDVLRQAADHVHRASGGEAADVLPSEDGGGQDQPQRGDLPTTGDGAPRDPAGLFAGTSG
ncbi:hypothetical protein [Streptomyces sp. NPDC026673]|uniref:hypothetical protein n=1 Tax=Streptomyces sp. NPDC026673 TaxID=3155724 RepID=UPI0033DB3880